jgi:hypothetical protein
MSFLKKTRFVSLVIALFLTAPPIFAATSPGLGQADTFSILSSSYVNTAGGTTINGDLGYTTPPVVSPTVNGTTHVADIVYNQAGIDQGTALTNLNSQPCTTTFAPGAVDLGSDTTHGPVGSYTPGVYCIDGAASIGGGSTITLTGSGTYIFRMNGALTTSANSVVVLAGGASACDIWWTPTAATTLGANSTFVGTDIDESGITIGSNVTWTGRALAFGGTVSTTTDTINTIPDCASSSNTDTTPPTTTPDTGSQGGGGAAGATAAATLAGTGSNTEIIAVVATMLVGFGGFAIVRKRNT